MSGPLWLQVVTAAVVTFTFGLFMFLIYRRYQERNAPPPEVEVHVSPYVCRPYLLSPIEQRFFVRLFQAVGGDYLICPKVRLADVIEVRGDALEWRGSWNRIAAKHVDFLLVALDSYQPLLAVEMEIDKPSGAEGPARDEWLLRALQASGMPVLRVKVRRDYDPSQLRTQIEQLLPR